MAARPPGASGDLQATSESPRSAGSEVCALVGCSSALTYPRQAASRRRSTASRRSAGTPSRCSPRARACGGRPSTRRRRSQRFRKRRRQARVKAVVLPRALPREPREPRPDSARELAGRATSDDGDGGRDRRRRRSSSTSARTSGSGSTRPSRSSSPALRELLELTTDDLWLCMENAAGTGGTIGRSIAELAALADAVDRHPRLGLCLDSCHWWASGVDVSDLSTLDEALADLDARVGIERVRVLHANDSQTPLGSNRDRHELVGAGAHRRRARDVPRSSGLQGAARDHGDVGGQGRGDRGPRPDAQISGDAVCGAGPTAGRRG